MNFLRTVFLAFLLYAIGVCAMKGFLSRRKDKAIQRQTSTSLSSSSSRIPWNQQSGDAIKNASARFIQRLMEHSQRPLDMQNSPYTYIRSLAVINPNVNLRPHAIVDPANPSQIILVTTDTSAFDPTNFLKGVQWALNAAIDLLEEFEQRTGNQMPPYDKFALLNPLLAELKLNSFPEYPPEYIKEALLRFYKSINVTQKNRREAFLFYYRTL